MELGLPKDLPLEGNSIEYFRRSLKLGMLVIKARNILHPVRARKRTIFGRVDKGRVIAGLDLSRKQWLDDLPGHRKCDVDIFSKILTDTNFVFSPVGS